MDCGADGVCKDGRHFAFMIPSEPLEPLNIDGHSHLEVVETKMLFVSTNAGVLVGDDHNVLVSGLVCGMWFWTIEKE